MTRMRGGMAFLTRKTVDGAIFSSQNHDSSETSLPCGCKGRGMITGLTHTQIPSGVTCKKGALATISFPLIFEM